jgi:Crinkler effector protein N-terminal domain
MINFSDIMIIFCLVLGENPKRRFSIDIRRDSDKKVGDVEISFDKLNFGHFQKLVHAEINSTSRASDLELWNVFIPTKGSNEKLKILQDHAENNAEIDIENQLGGVLLSPDDYIKVIFAKDPPDKHIHIIIEKPGKVLVW